MLIKLDRMNSNLEDAAVCFWYHVCYCNTLVKWSTTVLHEEKCCVICGVGKVQQSISLTHVTLWTDAAEVLILCIVKAVDTDPFVVQVEQPF